MSFINEPDLISEGALQAPGKLGAELEKVYAALMKILKAAKASEAAITLSKSTAKVTQETEKLVTSQKKLSIEQEKAAKIAKVLWLSENEVALAQRRASDTGKQLGAVTSDLDKEMIKAANSATMYGKAQKESNSQAANASKIYKAEAGSLQELTQRRIQLKNAIDSQKKNQQEDNDLLRKGIITRTELNKRMAESDAVIAKNNLSLQTVNAQIKTHILSNSALGNEYKKLTIALETARLKYKDLAASGTSTTAQLKAQQKVFEDLNKKVVTIDQAVGQFQRNVGNYPQTFNLATQSVSRFLAAFGVVTGLALFAKLMKEVIGLNAEFEASNSKLQGILGATRKEIEGLRKQQILLGETTAFTATQYSELQIELAKLGFPIDDIEQMTESTANAAIAMGSGLADQAELTGTVLRAFQLDASKSTEVNDQLSKSTAATALSFEKLATGLPYIATNAKLLGFSLDETLALMGRLSDTGLEASTIGTSLRSIFLRLADSSSALSKKFKEPVRDLPSFIKGLQMLKDEGTDLGEALELTDKRAVSAFTGLLAGVGDIERLSEEIKNANGFAKELAQTNLDNLKGDFTLFVASLKEAGRSIGEALDGPFRSIVKSATVFVQLLKGTPEFIKENKTELLAMGSAVFALNAKTITANASLLAQEIALKKVIIQERIATVSTGQLTASLFALTGPIGLLILAFAALAIGVDAYDRNSRRALEVERERRDLGEDITKVTNGVSEAQKLLNTEVEDWLKLSEDEKKNRIDLTDFTIKQTEALIKQLEQQKKNLGQTAEQLTLWQKIKVGAAAFAPGVAASLALSESQKNAAEATKGFNEQIQNLKNSLPGLASLMDKNIEADKQALLAKQALSDEEKKRLKELRLSQLELEKFRLEREAKIQEEIVNNEKASIDDRIAASLRLQNVRMNIADVERQTELTKGVKNSADLVLIEEQTQAKKTDAVKNGIKQRDKLNDDEIKRNYERALKAVQAEEDASKLLTDRLLNEINKRGDLEVQAIQERAIKGLIGKEQAEKEILEVQKKYAIEAANFQIDALGKQLNYEREIYYAERKKLIEESYLDEAEKILAIQALDAESAEEQAAIAQKIHDLRMGLTNSSYEGMTERFAEENAALQKLSVYYDEYASKISQIFANITAQRIMNLQAESDANAKKLEKDLEMAGDNEKAKELIQQRARKKEEELEKRRREEQRKGAQREKAFALISATIRTASAVLNALSTVQPYPAAVIAAISAGALGALEIATIATAPIPAYEFGTPFKPDSGAALVGEVGTEAMISPQGDLSFTPGVPTVMNIPRGTEIIPHKETMQRLALGALSQNGGTSQNYYTDPALLQEMRQVNANLKNIKPAPRQNLIRSGSVVYHAIEQGKANTVIRRAADLGTWWMTK